MIWRIPTTIPRRGPTFSAGTMTIFNGSSLNFPTRKTSLPDIFLVETADHTNNRIGQRLAVLLTERHQDDSTLFVQQEMADSISRSFQQSLTIDGFVGTI